MSLPPVEVFRTWLRALPSPQLAEILRRRPDTLHPIPPTADALATRLTLNASLTRYLATTPALSLAIVEALTDLGGELHGVTTDALADQLRTLGDSKLDDASFNLELQELRKAGIIFDEKDLLRIVPGALSALPPDFTALRGTTYQVLAKNLSTITDSQHKILRTLSLAGGVGHSRDAAIDADPTRDIPQLLAAGLLERLDGYHVRLPRAVAHLLHAKDTAPLPLRSIEPPSVENAQAQRAADGSGMVELLETSRQIEQLITLLSEQPIETNKDGRPGVRAAGVVAKQLGLPAERIHLLVTLANAAGLLHLGLARELPAGYDNDANYLAPTPQADEWLSSGLAERSVWLLRGYHANAFAHWYGGRLLGEEQQKAQLKDQRRFVLKQLCAQPVGIGLSNEDLWQHLSIKAPLIAANITQQDFQGLVDEAQAMGISSGGIATTLARAGNNSDALEQAFSELLPAETDAVIVQADLTIMTTGPLEPELEKTLRLMADLEIPGIASMYRISEGSIRRALDSGRSGEELIAWLKLHALGELPQALKFLIEDTARHHGQLRSGAISSYLRSNDEAIIAAIMNSPAAEQAQLTHIAPTVAVSPLVLAEVLQHLRAAGFHPVTEDSSGATIDYRPEPVRTFKNPPLPAEEATGTTDDLIERALSALRAEDKQRPKQQTGDYLTSLQAAARAGRNVRVSVVDANAIARTFTLKPLTVSGGQVDAIDEKTGRVHRFAIHRITDVRLD